MLDTSPISTQVKTLPMLSPTIIYKKTNNDYKPNQKKLSQKYVDFLLELLHIKLHCI